MNRNIFSALLVVLLVVLSSSSQAKVKQLSPTVPLRPVAIKNVSYASSGKFFAVPNAITAGSVGIFSVAEDGKIAALPARFSEKSFSRSAGVFYYQGSKEGGPVVIFLPLPELLSGYSVSFTTAGDTLAIAGGDKVLIFEAEGWKQIRSVTITNNTTRAVFSPDGTMMAAVADGRVYVLNTRTYSLMYTLDPVAGHQFADVAFSHNNSKLAVFEYRTTVMDYASRVRIFMSSSGEQDRELPYLPDKISSAPGNHFPLLSYSPGDTVLAVTIEKFRGKVALLKSNDGTVVREFKGLCHAYSPDGTLFAAGSKIYSTSTWESLGNFSSSALAVTFSPTERVLIVITPDTLRRYKIEE